MVKSNVDKEKSPKKKDEYLVLIGQRIEKNVKKGQFTKTEFAELIGSSRPQLQRIFDGDVNSSILQLRKICKVLDMSLSSLVKE